VARVIWLAHRNTKMPVMRHTSERITSGFSFISTAFTLSGHNQPTPASESFTPASESFILA
jgi:hypothetical protein